MSTVTLIITLLVQLIQLANKVAPSVIGIATQIVTAVEVLAMIGNDA